MAVTGYGLLLIANQPAGFEGTTFAPCDPLTSCQQTLGYTFSQEKSTRSNDVESTIALPLLVEAKRARNPVDTTHVKGRAGSNQRRAQFEAPDRVFKFNILHCYSDC